MSIETAQCNGENYPLETGVHTVHTNRNLQQDRNVWSLLAKPFNTCSVMPRLTDNTLFPVACRTVGVPPALT